MPIIGIQSSAGMKPTTPTIGTASDGGTGTTVSVAFTPSTYIGKGTITYTALSSPGSITATGSGSPITVSGLTTGTAYTFTVKGDTNYGVASDYSAASNSVTPASPSSFESIATLTPTSGTSVAFTSIPSTYKSLQIRIAGRSTSTGTFDLRVNSLTGIANYYTHYLYGTGGSAFASYENQVNGISEVIKAPGATGIIGTGIVDIVDYASTSKLKTVRGFSGWLDPALGRQVRNYSGWINTTSAISTITIIATSGFLSGTSIALYGVK